MALSPAERKRRSRRHRQGDHAACDPQRCGALAREVTIAGTATKVDEPGTGLAELLTILESEVGTSASTAQRALLLVARRLSARLDRLHDYLEGRSDTWMRLHARTDDGSTVEVVVDAALSEERQVALALRQILADVKGTAKPASAGVSRRDDIAAQRAKRLAAARVSDSAGS